MKITFSSIPETFAPYDNASTLVCYAYREVQRTVPSPSGEITVTEYEGDCVTVPTPATYANVVDAIIREQYAVCDELALLRQKDSKPEDFATYNTFCESAKAKARVIFPQ